MAKLEGGHAAYVFTSGMAAIDCGFSTAAARATTCCFPKRCMAASIGLPRNCWFISDWNSASSILRTRTLGFGGDAAEHQDALCRNADQSDHEHHRHRRDGQDCVSDRNATLVVDNTFLSPYLQRPIELGAHIVVHSMTKYLNGHSDSTGGAVVLTRPEDAEKIYFMQRSAGAGLAPMDCFLVSRGIKTLAVRMLQHNANGIAVAQSPGRAREGAQGLLPGPAFAPAARNRAANSRRGSGAMISFDLGSMEAARRFSTR